jgi:YD repeat-containing protein
VQAAVLLLLCLSLAIAQSTLAVMGLSGPITAVEEYQVDVDTGERQLVRLWTFDAAGILVERVFYQYDIRDGSLRWRQVTLFDAGERLATVVYNAAGEPTGQTVYRYDEAGNMVEELSVDAGGVETWRTHYEYDPVGRLLGLAQYRAGALERSVELDYDASGALIEEREFDVEGRLRQLDRYLVPGVEYEYVAYDEGGEVEMSGRGMKGEFGPTLIEVLDPDGTLLELYEWVYDDRGRLLEHRTEGDWGEEYLTYTYDDDAWGNWVRTTTSEDYGYGPEVSEIRERVISYR